MRRLCRRGLCWRGGCKKRQEEKVEEKDLHRWTQRHRGHREELRRLREIATDAHLRASTPEGHRKINRKERSARYGTGARGGCAGICVGAGGEDGPGVSAV